MAYTRINWQDLPSTTTPRNATNLNKMDSAIKDHDDQLLGNTSMGNIVVDSIKTGHEKLNSITSGDFNSLINTQTAGNITRYYINATNLTNQPTASNGWLTSFYQSNNTQVQIFVANNAVIYRRNKVAGNWGSWSSL